MNFRSFISGVALWVFMVSGHIAFGQSVTDPVIEQLIEEIAQNQSEDFDVSELTERLNDYRRHPIDINKAGKEQLQELVFLLPVQIDALLKHIAENGPLIELMELQSIDGFDLATIRRLLNFIYLPAGNSLSGIRINDLIHKSEHDLLLRYSQLLERPEGYRIADSVGRSRYLGSPQRLLLRYRYRFGNHISASWNMEKDAGEPYFFKAKNRVFDFYSGNVFIKDWGKLSKLTVGDYSLQFGQGLSLWSGLNFGKGPSVSEAVKSASGLQPYRSFNESLFFRGVAATFKHRKWMVTPFISFRKNDASLSTGDSLQQAEISSLGISGLHRTEAELKSKNGVSQMLYGSNVQYSGHHLSIGLTASHTRFDHAFERGGSLYNKFEFAGKSLNNLALNYGFSFRNSYLFGELAKSAPGGGALLSGLMVSLSSKVSLALLYRNYQKDYYSFYNQAFAESANSVNEEGFYSGIIIKPHSKWELLAYADAFRFPWLRFSADAPSKGYELFSQLSYVPNKEFRVSLRFKMESKEENDDQLNGVHTLKQVQKQLSRLEVNYKVLRNFTLRNRIEMVHYHKEKQPIEIGFMTYLELNYDPDNSRFSGNFRFAIFDTPGFNSRIYTYESDVLYSYSVPAYQNRGVRFYLNSRMRMNRQLDVWTRYSLSSFTDRVTIGSGLEQIDGNKRSEIKLQIRYQF